MIAHPLSDRTSNHLIPKEKARENLTERLVAVFGLEHRYATAVARLFVDPTRVRRQIETPYTKRIPGGSVVYLTGDVFSAAVSASPINPRTNEYQIYPFALADKSDKYPPLRVRSAPDNQPIIRLFARNRDHIEHILTTSAEFLRSNGELRDAVVRDGVMEPVTLLLAELNHDDSIPPAVVPISIDGSTRTTHCHDLLDLNPVEVAYRWPQSTSREWNGFLGQLLSRHATTDEASDDMPSVQRVLTYPARILIAVQPDNPRKPITMVDAGRAIVNGIHVDRPEPWPDGAQRDEIADTVLDHLVEASRISLALRDYLAGLMTPEDLRQREEAGIEVFPLHPDERAAVIARIIFADRNNMAVSAGYRSVITKRSVSPKDKADVAGELMMRAFRHTMSVAERRSARASFERALILREWREQEWRVSQRQPDELLAAALQELREGRQVFGSDRLELGLLGTYWLIAKNGLRRDNRETTNQRQDSEVVASMLETPRGLYQLHRAIVDGRSDPRCGEPIRAVDRNGDLKVLPTGEYDFVSPKWLRMTFGGSIEATDNMDSPAIRTDRARRDVYDVVELLDRKIKTAHPHLMKDGISPKLAQEMANRLQNAALSILTWGQRSTVLQHSFDQEDNPEATSGEEDVV